MSFTEGHAWQAVGWGARGEGRGGSWGGAAPSCPGNQSLCSEQGSGHHQGARGVSFLLDTGLGWRLPLPWARGRRERAVSSVGLRGISSSSHPGSPAALGHVGPTSAAAPQSHPAQPRAHPGPQAGPSQPSDKCQLCALTASGQDGLRLSRPGPVSSTCGG